MMWLIFLPLKIMRCGASSAATAPIEIFEATKVSQTHNNIEYRLSGRDCDYFSLVFSCVRMHSTLQNGWDGAR